MEQLARTIFKFDRWQLKQTRSFTHLIMVATLLLLGACGGGSGGTSAGPVTSDVIADAGEDQFVQPGDTVTLDGSLTESMSGVAISYAWSLKTIPENSTALLVNSDVVDPVFVADVEGIYIVELVVNGGSVESQIDTVTINAGGFPIVETAIVNRSPGMIPEEMKVSCWANPDATRSSECPVINYNDVQYWSYSYDDNRFSLGIVGFNQDGRVVYKREAPTIRHIRRISVDEATQTVTFFGESASGEGEVTLTWQDLTSNLIVPEPEADAGPNQIYTPGEAVMLDGTGSYGVAELAYDWSFESIPEGSTAMLSNVNDPQPTFVADMPGSYVVQLVVNDGTTDSIADTVIITSSNIPLVGEEMAANPPGNIPEGMNVSCAFGPGRSGNPLCPVLIYNDLTYWAFSYRDNRGSLGIVGYDSAGNIAFEQEAIGTRYVWQITVDIDASTVSFFGEFGSATLSWEELTP